MAPIKFEENIKDKLEQRVLTPSPKSWSDLAGRLDKEQQKSKKPVFWWFGIAASVAAIVFISLLYINNDPSGSMELPEIVNEEVDVKPLEENTNTKSLVTQEEGSEKIAEVERQDSMEETSKVPAKNQKTVKEDSKTKSVSKQNILNNTAVASINEAQQEKNVDQVENSVKSVMTESAIEDIRVDAVVEEINKIKSQNNNTVTDRQIDSLLKIANKELFNERLAKEKTNVVDADALLQDVEEDLGQSFRSKVYEALKNGYNKVKTSVAERNN